MPITYPFPPPLAAGAMVATRIVDDLAELRRFLNGGITTPDLDPDVVLPQHIFRPDSYGYPSQSGHFASGRILYSRNDATDSIDIRSQTRRIDMTPAMATRAAAVPMTSRLGMTVDYWDDVSSDVRIGANWSAYVGAQYNKVLVALYAGYFQMKYREQSTGTETIVTASMRTVNVSTNDIGNQYGRYATQGHFTMTRGKWDVWVEWCPDYAASDSDLVGSVAIGMANFTLASHRTAT